MARLQKLKLPKGVEIDEVSNDNFFTHPSARSVPTTLAVKDYLHDEIDKHDQAFWPDGLHRNAIINGNFDIWQRGTSFENIGAGNVYLADRWVSRASEPTTDVYRSTDVPGPGSNYSLELRCGKKTAYSNIEYTIEQSIAKTLGVVPLTVSFYVKVVQGTTGLLRLRTRYPGAVDNWSSYSDGQTIKDFVPPSEWQRVSATFTPNATEIERGFALNIVTRQDSETELILRIAQVQMNIGDKPLPFAPRPYAEELALCQRYFISLRGDSQDIWATMGTGLVFSPTIAWVVCPIPTSMRCVPTVISRGNLKLMAPGTIPNPTLSVLYSTSTAVTLQAEFTGGTPGGACILAADADLAGDIWLSAEL